MDTELLILAILPSVPSRCSEALAKNSGSQQAAQPSSAALLNLPRADRSHKIAAMPPKRYGIWSRAARFKSLICPECTPHVPDSSASISFLRIASNATRTLHSCEGLVLIIILDRRSQ
jgi:hypothetical protein